MTINTSANNKRIAKNTIVLYVRMLLIMLVTLYTSRVVLEVLGIEDYGIYNVVGGVITLLSFLNSALNTATQRYMNYEMGKNNHDGLRKVFSMSFILFFIIALVVVVLSETIGLWFVKNYLVIPEPRMDAALWVFQFSVLTFIISLIGVPYNAAIIAHERMEVYAYVSIVEVVLKLALVYTLRIIDADKLILYAILMALVQILIFISYKIYCKRKFDECTVKWIWDKPLLKGLFSFSGWMLSGTITNVLSTQGVNVLINMFFGPTMNAARGIAMQVYGAVNSFVANFMTAVRPQICKSYAQGDMDYMYKLVFSSSRLSFFLLFILSLPLIFNTNQILSIWLKEVPKYSVIFTQLVLINLLVTAVYSSIAYVSQASGKVKHYQLVISIGFVLIAVLTWAAYRMGLDVTATFIIAIAVDVIGLFARLLILHRIVDFPIMEFFKRVMLPIVCVIIISVLVSAVPFLVFNSRSILFALSQIAWCVLVTGVSIWLCGLGNQEKQLILSAVNKIIRKR